MDDPVRGEGQKGGEERKAGIAETDRRTLLRTAGLAGVAFFEAANVPAGHQKIEAEGRGVQGDDDRQRITERVRD